MHEAYECLVDPMRRHQYDCQLNSGCATQWAHPHCCGTLCQQRPACCHMGNNCAQCSMGSTGYMGQMGGHTGGQMGGPMRSHMGGQMGGQMGNMGTPVGGPGFGGGGGGMPPPMHPHYSRPSSMMVEMSMDAGSHHGSVPRFPRGPFPSPDSGLFEGPAAGPMLPPGRPGHHGPPGPFGPPGPPPPPGSRFRSMGGPPPPPHGMPIDMEGPPPGHYPREPFGPPRAPMMRQRPEQTEMQGSMPGHFSIRSKAF